MLALLVAALVVVTMHEPVEGEVATVAQVQGAEETLVEPGPVVVATQAGYDGWASVAVHAGVLCLLCLYLVVLTATRRSLRRPTFRPPYERVGYRGGLDPPLLAPRPAPDLTALSISRT